jgi:hypothetical protein
LNLTKCAIHEIHDFHTFLVAWSKGAAPENPDLLAQRLAGFDPDFRYITPSGRVRGLADLETWLRTSHGSQPSLRIEITNIDARRADSGSALLTYEERQASDENSGTRRLATSVFLPNADAPHGAAWFHLHEVWLP